MHIKRLRYKDRLFSKELERSGSYSVQSIYEEFLKNFGKISVENDTIKVFFGFGYT